MREDFLYNALGLAIALALSKDAKITNCNYVLAMGIDDVIDEGYTKEEIRDFILAFDYSLINKNITEAQKKSIQEDLLEILDYKYSSYLEQEEKSYIKK